MITSDHLYKVGLTAQIKKALIVFNASPIPTRSISNVVGAVTVNYRTTTTAYSVSIPGLRSLLLLQPVSVSLTGLGSLLLLQPAIAKAATNLEIKFLDNLEQYIETR
jgi:hypothetical protein